MFDCFPEDIFLDKKFIEKFLCPICNDYPEFSKLSKRNIQKSNLRSGLTYFWEKVHRALIEIKQNLSNL